MGFLIAFGIIGTFLYVIFQGIREYGLFQSVGYFFLVIGGMALGLLAIVAIGLYFTIGMHMFM